MQQLASILRARSADDRSALVFESERLSFRELWLAVEAMGGQLRAHHVRAGSKVMVALSNSPSLPISMMALSAIDAVCIAVDPFLSEHERDRILGIAQPDYILGARGEHSIRPAVWLSRLERSDEPVDAQLDGVSTIIFTSGTTGQPKGVMLSAAALLVNARSVADYLRLGPDDRTLVFLPLFYSYPLSQLLSTWLVGGAVVLMKNLRFPRVAVSLISEHGVTGIAGVPASLGLIAEHVTAPTPSLRYVMNAGGPLSLALAQHLRAVFPSASLFNNYGCTEIGPRATAIDYTQHPEHLGSIGKAISQVNVRLIRPDLVEAMPGEIAEIVLSGPTLMKGYYRDAETTASRMSRWGFHTGDYASAGEDGFLYFQGRQDDVFKSGGEKVSAREIEEVLLEHRAVREAAVVAESDPLMGSVPVAYVVSSDEGHPSSEELQVFCRHKLSQHKTPRRIHFVPRLERTASGKVQKFRLKDSLTSPSREAVL